MSKLFTAEELKNGKMLCNPLFLPLLLNELEAPLTREQIDEKQTHWETSGRKPPPVPKLPPPTSMELFLMMN